MGANYRAIVGGKLKTARLMAGFSQAELAKQWGTTQSRVSNIELGRSPLPLEDIPDLCRIFQIHRDFWWNWFGMTEKRIPCESCAEDPDRMVCGEDVWVWGVEVFEDVL